MDMMAYNLGYLQALKDLDTLKDNKFGISDREIYCSYEVEDMIIDLMKNLPDDLK